MELEDDRKTQTSSSVNIKQSFLKVHKHILPKQFEINAFKIKSIDKTRRRARRGRGKKFKIK